MLPEIEPILPKLVRDVPRGRDWLYELKLDGFRGTLYVEHERGRFLSKTKKRMDLEGIVAKRRGDAYAPDNGVVEGEASGLLAEGRAGGAVPSSANVNSRR